MNPPPAPGAASSARRRPARKLSLSSAFASAAALAVSATVPGTPSSSTPSSALSPPLISLPPASPSLVPHAGSPPALGLFQQCLRLSAGLERVPGFTDRYGCPAAATPSPGLPRSQSQASLPSSPSSLSLSLDSSDDVVGQLWACLRAGSALCYLFNALGERQLPLTASATQDDSLDLPTSAQVKQAKHLTAKFIMALRASPSPQFSGPGATALSEAGLGWDSESCFSVSDLFRDDTNGFIRVVRTVDRLLELLESRGRLLPAWTGTSSGGISSDVASPSTASAEPFFLAPTRIAMPPGGPNAPPASPTPSGADACASLLPRVIQELLTTERNYVADLERIQAFAQVLSKYEALGRDMLHAIFCNLDQIVDVQRRLLARIEQVLCPAQTVRDKLTVSPGGLYLHEVERQAHAIGRVFCTMGPDLYIYQPFCANYSHALGLATREASAIVSARMVGRPDVDQCYLDPYYSLGAFLIKPIQRICKYPLLFDEMIKRISTVSTARAKRAGKALVQARAVLLDVVAQVNDSGRHIEKHSACSAQGISSTQTSPIPGRGRASALSRKDEQSSDSYFDFVPDRHRSHLPVAKVSNAVPLLSPTNDVRSSGPDAAIAVEQLNGPGSASKAGSPRGRGHNMSPRTPMTLLPPLAPWAARSFTRARSAPVSPITPNAVVTTQSSGLQTVSAQEVLSSPASAPPSHIISKVSERKQNSSTAAPRHSKLLLDRETSISGPSTMGDLHTPGLHGLGLEIPMNDPTSSPTGQIASALPGIPLTHGLILQDRPPMPMADTRSSPGLPAPRIGRVMSSVAKSHRDCAEECAHESVSAALADQEEHNPTWETRHSHAWSTEAFAPRSVNAQCASPRQSSDPSFSKKYKATSSSKLGLQGYPAAQCGLHAVRSPLSRLESDERPSVRSATRAPQSFPLQAEARDTDRNDQGHNPCLDESWSSDWPKLDWENLSPEWPFDQPSDQSQESGQCVATSPGCIGSQAPLSSQSSAATIPNQQFQWATDWQDDFELAAPVLLPPISRAPGIQVETDDRSPSQLAGDGGRAPSATSPAICTALLPPAPSVASSLATITAHLPPAGPVSTGNATTLAPAPFHEVAVETNAKDAGTSTPQRPPARTEKVTRDLLAALGLSFDTDSPSPPQARHAREECDQTSRRSEASNLHSGRGAWRSPPASPTPSRPSESGDEWSYRSSMTRSRISSYMSSTAGDSVGLMTPLSAAPSLDGADGSLGPFWHGVPPDLRSKQSGSTAGLGGTPLSGTTSSRYWGVGHSSSSMSYSASHASGSTGATTPVSTSGWGLSPLVPSSSQFPGGGSERWSTSSARPPSQAPSMECIKPIDGAQPLHSVIPFPTVGAHSPRSVASDDHTSCSVSGLTVPCLRSVGPHPGHGGKSDSAEPAAHGLRMGLRSVLRPGAEKHFSQLPARAHDAGLAGHRPTASRPIPLDLSDADPAAAGTKPLHSRPPPRVKSLTRLRAHASHNPF